MGYVDFKSHIIQLPASAEAVFHFVRDLNNFEKLMPEQVVNWQSTESDCEFDIKGMAHIRLKKEEEIPHKSVLILSGPDNPIELKIKAFIEEEAKNSSSAHIILSANLSPILQMMASSPLQNLVNIMADRLKAVFNV
jgi:carbon monoxide dehydrogenase subunit G